MQFICAYERECDILLYVNRDCTEKRFVMRLIRRKTDEDMTYYYQQALRHKKIPLLPLDPKWHELFPDYRKTGEIHRLEKELNKLIKKQGQTNNDVKEYEKAKKILMNNIVENMTDGHEYDSPIRAKKQDKNQKLMEELSTKMKEANNRIEELPDQIKEANEMLLVECMQVCYDELMANSAEIEAADEKIKQIREEMKNLILVKQDKEMRNTEMYKYMHNLLGREVVEVFDQNHKVWKGNLEENDI